VGIHIKRDSQKWSFAALRSLRLCGNSSLLSRSLRLCGNSSLRSGGILMRFMILMRQIRCPRAMAAQGDGFDAQFSLNSLVWVTYWLANDLLLGHTLSVSVNAGAIRSNYAYWPD
jgi:hypothetical protein